jgi:Flp pilus assembly protein TadG
MVRGDAKNRSNRRGAVVILVLLLMVILFAGVAFAIDVGYMQLVRTQLRNATDAAAIAGASTLEKTGDAAKARIATKDFAALNVVAGKPLTLSDSDIVFGKMVTSGGVSTFQPGVTPFDAVRVNGELSATSASGPVNLFFGPFLNRSTFSPQMFATGTVSDLGKRDLCVVVDRSGSMNDDKKWAGLLTAFDYLISGMGNTADTEQLGLVSYSTLSGIDARLTTNYDAVRTKLRTWSPGGYTNINGGMKDAITVLTDGTMRRDARPMMVIMTDGIHNRGGDPVEAAYMAKNAGILCIAITFGKGADQNKMRQVAEITGGQFYHAPTAADLQKIFTDIGRNAIGVSFAE